MKGKTIVILAALLSPLLCGCSRTKGEALMIGSGSETAAEPVPAAETKADSQKAALAEEPQIQPEIIVYVCGAVNRPGVVTLSAGSRAEDALKAAGGFSEEADVDFINLADWLTDGQKLYFPTEEESSGLAEAQGQDCGGRININTADAAALCTLSGIGESRASDIIDYREQNGSFSEIQDIMKVPGIKESVYNKISGKITVN